MKGMWTVRLVTLTLAVSGAVACGNGDTPTTPGSGAPSSRFNLAFTGQALQHAGQSMSVRVIKDSDGTVVAEGSEVIAPTGAFSFSFSGIFEANQAYHLDFYADQNSSGSCDPPPEDHTWRESLGVVTGHVMYHWEHNGSFVNVCASFG
jgi:hypothetical protein